MDEFLVITQGMGLALACGVRPLLPTLLAGTLAGADTGLDFDGTDYSFLEAPVFLIVLVAGVAAVVGYERRRPGVFTDGPPAAALGGVAIGLGALLFAGSLADEGHAAWPGLLAGAACAALAGAATRNFFTRVRGRLDESARAAVAVYEDGGALLLAALSIAIPPVALVALVGFVVLLIRGRRRDDRKYAGLRVLR